MTRLPPWDRSAQGIRPYHLAALQAAAIDLEHADSREARAANFFFNKIAEHLPGMWDVVAVTAEVHAHVAAHGVTPASRRALSRDHLVPRRESFAYLAASVHAMTVDDLRDFVRGYAGRCAVVMRHQNPPGLSTGHGAGHYRLCDLWHLPVRLHTQDVGAALPLRADTAAIVLAAVPA